MFTFQKTGSFQGLKANEDDIRVQLLYDVSTMINDETKILTWNIKCHYPDTLNFEFPNPVFPLA